MFSVDIETSGPIPGQYSLLSIGACLVEDPSVSFYIELKPDREGFLPEAMAIHGLSLQKLKDTASPPLEAMQTFARWIKTYSAENGKAVFVAFNAPFDWMFINDYFYRYLGYNPFGHTALDIKAYFMGQSGMDWQGTSMKKMSKKFLSNRHLTHNALADAQDQAELFRAVLNQTPKDQTQE
ncbi:MAG: 3'-5' exonuclease [Chloroflexi bacterium]|nr:3'-5' exonuclease [Chloroflexota bacterium]